MRLQVETLEGGGRKDHASKRPSGRIPAGRRERGQIVAIGHGGQAGEDVAQIRERILAVALAGE